MHCDSPGRPPGSWAALLRDPFSAPTLRIPRMEACAMLHPQEPGRLPLPVNPPGAQRSLAKSLGRAAVVSLWSHFHDPWVSRKDSTSGPGPEQLGEVRPTQGGTLQRREQTQVGQPWIPELVCN